MPLELQACTLDHIKQLHVQDLMVCTFEELQQGGPDGLFGPETLTTDLMHLTAAHHRSETFCTSCLLYRKEGPFRYTAQPYDQFAGNAVIGGEHPTLSATIKSSVRLTA